MYQANKIIFMTIKAGFSYFKAHKQGKIALQCIVNKLYNINDQIPPTDSLKLYRAYYGDQLALLFTSLELANSSSTESHRVECIGHDKNSLVTFGSDPKIGSIWIPPASKRNENFFKLIESEN